MPKSRTESASAVVHDERQQRREPGAGRGQRRRSPVVVLRSDVQVAVDQPGQDVLAGRVDDAVGAASEERGGADGGDPAVLDDDIRFDDVGGGDDAPAADDDVHSARAHR